MAWTIALWALGTGVYAYIYVASRLAIPNAVGDETEWTWQLSFFFLGRLPFLILLLGALLYVEHRLFSRDRRDGV